jgi:DNA-binding NtrC family response regulator
MAHIYVLDDEPMLLDLISAVLRLDGHEVTALGHAGEACDAIIATQTPVDLLIADAEMRPMSGVQAVSHLRMNRIQCPVIFMSGHHGLVAVITESFGRPAVMEKPFTAGELRRVVQKTLAASQRRLHHVD